MPRPRIAFRPALIKKDVDGTLALTPRWGGHPLSRISGFVIFFDKTGDLTPSVFTHFTSKLVALPDVSVFFHLHPVETPSVPDEERYHISRFASVPGCYRLVVRHGYMDEVVSPDLGVLIYEQIHKFVMTQVGTKPVAASEQNTTTTSESAGNTEGLSERVAAELARLDRAHAQKVL